MRSASLVRCADRRPSLPTAPDAGEQHDPALLLAVRVRQAVDDAARTGDLRRVRGQLAGLLIILRALRDGR